MPCRRKLTCIAEVCLALARRYGVLRHHLIVAAADVDADAAASARRLRTLSLTSLYLAPLLLGEISSDNKSCVALSITVLFTRFAGSWR